MVLLSLHIYRMFDNPQVTTLGAVTIERFAPTAILMATDCRRRIGSARSWPIAMRVPIAYPFRITVPKGLSCRGRPLVTTMHTCSERMRRGFRSGVGFLQSHQPSHLRRSLPCYLRRHPPKPSLGIQPNPQPNPQPSLRPSHQLRWMSLRQPRWTSRCRPRRMSQLPPWRISLRQPRRMSLRQPRWMPLRQPRRMSQHQPSVACSSSASSVHLMRPREAILRGLQVTGARERTIHVCMW
jgi:hypothetical protein